MVGKGEVVAGAQGIEVIVAQNPFPVGEVLFVQFDCLGEVPGLLIAAGEVVADAQGVGVVFSPNAFIDREVLFVQFDRLGEPSRLSERHGDAVEGLQGVRVVVAQNPLLVDQGLLEQRNCFIEVAGRLVCAGEPVAG